MQKLCGLAPRGRPRVFDLFFHEPERGRGMPQQRKNSAQSQHRMADGDIAALRGLVARPLHFEHLGDDRKYTLAECRQLVDFLKADGCTVMLGVPAHWRELKADAVSDPALLEVLKAADIISPWTVGRYTNPAGAAEYAENLLKGDLAWCRERQMDYLPVVFPGFSWHNLKGGPVDQIPRRRGEFLWSEFRADKQAGAAMLYVAMFDEMDEGTAIFKCGNDMPAGQASKFVTYEGLPSDFYLKLVGAGTKMLRGEIPVTAALPAAR